MTLAEDDAVVTSRPASVSEAADLLRGTRGPVLFRGSGTKLAWAGRPARPSLVVDTRSLSYVRSYHPADMTVAVGAGMPLRDLQSMLAERNQWVALDPPTEAQGATIGGLLATGESGPRRLRYGALRDLIIGVTLVLADGTVARSGGNVIKNVAGYDLSKVLYGSLGTLGLIAEVVLRLHPVPQASATAEAAMPLGPALEAAARLRASPLEPSAVDWAHTGGGLLAVRVEGTAAGVRSRQPAVDRLLRAGAANARWCTGADEQNVWRQLAAHHQPAGAGVTFATAGTLPSRTGDVAEALTRAGDAFGVTTSLATRPPLGLHTASFDGAPAAVVRAFTAWRERVLALGGTVLLKERPREVEAGLDVLGPAPGSAPLLRALCRRLDPDGRCAAGRLGRWTALPAPEEDSHDHDRP